VDRWHAVSGFRGEKSQKFMHLGFAILRTPKRRGTEGPLNSQSRECIGETTYRGSGVGKAKLSDIASAEIAIGKTPIRVKDCGLMRGGHMDLGIAWGGGGAKAKGASTNQGSGVREDRNSCRRGSRNPDTRSFNREMCHVDT
jgi:hypothetical protein